MLRVDMADTNKNSREFDLVLWGASGFTGRLVAEHLFEVYGIDRDLHWAMAGRNAQKLDQIRSGLGAGAERIPILIGDSSDAASLNAMTGRTRVVCTTVGPYLKHGEGMLAACATSGTDYCDLTGEVLFIRKMIDRYEPDAQRTGARIVNACGFDSLPSDLGTLFIQDEFNKRYQHYASDVRYRLKVAKGTFSGGTIDSMLNTLDTVKADASLRKIFANPYALNPQAQQHGRDGKDQRAAAFDAQFGAWTAPFVMAGINTRVVRRSNAIMGYPWGEDFSYTEAVATGTGFGGRLKATLLGVGLGAFMFAAGNKLLRALMFRMFLPKPGEGPTAEQRRDGFFNIAFLASDDGGNRLRGKLTGDRDPGYGATSRMLGETAVCLAKDLGPEMPGGFWTPAASVGERLIGRLTENAGIQFSVTGTS
jgi:short subunit dehydrogenase-like uncharacterized protein